MAKRKTASPNGKHPPAMTPGILDIEAWPIERVIPYARNPRKNAGAVAKVAASLKEFGWRQPIVVDAERVIIAGHTRFFAAQQLGMMLVPVHVATDLPPAKVKAYRLADNRTGEEAEWDTDLLSLEFNDIELDGGDLSWTGFDRIEWLRSLGRLNERADAAAEWEGMPEFISEDREPFRTIKVHFDNQTSVDAFAEIVGQKILPDTAYLWHPKQERVKQTDKRYESAT